MSVYKLFASKDASIYSEHPTMNTGMDAILDLGKENSSFSTGSAVSRALIQFADDDILSVIGEYTIAAPKFFLRTFLSEAKELPTGITIAADPIAQPWEMGTGKYMNFPYTTDGVNWYSASVDTAWDNAGGTWITGSTVTQSFGVYEEKDINLDVTGIVNKHLSGSIANNGFILRNIIPVEFDGNYQYTLSYFSRDTNTIYPPVLEVKWDDSHFADAVTGSVATTSLLNVSLANNKTEYREAEVVQFRINVREQYPERRFATSSIYTEQQFLPPATHWAVQDVRDDIMVIDFDEQYTKVSADVKGNYFTIYMNGLEPERYYKMLIKTVIDNQTIVFDNQYFFKIIG